MAAAAGAGGAGAAAGDGSGPTLAEIREMKQMFQLFDKEGSDVITAKELGAVMRALGQNPTEAEMQQMIAEVDTSKTDTIDFPAFLAMCQRIVSAGDDANEIIDAFAVFDKDGRGYVTTAELREVMTTLGEKLTAEQVDALVADADSSGSGQVDYRAFVASMSS